MRVRLAAPGSRLTWSAVGGLALGLISGLGLTACAPEPPAPLEIRTLEAGQRWELSFPKGEMREIRFPLREGWYLELAVHQQGLDVVSQLLDPALEIQIEVDTTSGDRGTEELAIVAEQQGEYRLFLGAMSQPVGGSVEVEVRAYHPAEAEDRKRADALAALARGRLAWMAGDLPGAETVLRQALPPLVELEDRRRETEARHLLGEMLGLQEKWTPAAEELERARDGYRELGRTAGEAMTSNQLGIVLRRLGRSLAAEGAYRQALSLARRAEAEFVEAAVLHNLGLLAQQQGELEEAHDLFEQALALRRRIGPPGEIALVLRRLGALYTLIGRDEDALALVDEASSIAAADDSAEEQARALDDLAWTRHWAGESAQALSDYATALELAQEAGDEALEVALLARRVTVLRGLGRFQQARDDLDRVIRWRRAAGDRVREGYAWANLGEVELAAGRLNEARRAFQQAATLLGEGGSGEDRYRVELGLGKVERRAGRWHQGREHLEAALQTVEDMRVDLTSRLSRDHVLGVRFEPYEELIGLLMDRHREQRDGGFDREALEVAEQARARGLVEDLTARTTGSTRGDGPPALRRIRGLELERLELQRTAPDSPRLEELDEELRLLWLEAERSAELAAPRPASAHHLDVAEMQELVDETTRLVVFSLGEPESYVWVVSPETVRPYRLPGRRLLSELARETASAMARSNLTFGRQAAERKARELSQRLLAPAAEALDGRRLVFVPDGALYLVPFAALPDPSVDSDQRDLLLDHFEIAVVSSPSVLALQRQIEESAPSEPRDVTRIAVFADPVYESDDPRLAKELGRAAGSPQELPEDLQRSVDALDLSRLPRLQQTGAEARAILAHRPSAAGLLAEGFAARRELVTSGELTDYPILHFAAHGLLHPVHPDLSGIVLSLFDETGRAVDGFLRAYEVARLDLPARLVVLSACRTALGHEVRGEAPIGLIQAFFRAGSRRVLASNWKVDDAATAELMARFYAALLEEGRPPAAALRQAQLALRRSEEWKEPYFWAAFQLHGEWRGSFSQQNR